MDKETLRQEVEEFFKKDWSILHAAIAKVFHHALRIDEPAKAAEVAAVADPLSPVVAVNPSGPSTNIAELPANVMPTAPAVEQPLIAPDTPMVAVADPAAPMPAGYADAAIPQKEDGVLDDKTETEQAADQSGLGTTPVAPQPQYPTTEEKTAE